MFTIITAEFSRLTLIMVGGALALEKMGSIARENEAKEIAYKGDQGIRGN